MAARRSAVMSLLTGSHNIDLMTSPIAAAG